MRDHRRSENRYTLARSVGLMKIGEQLRAEYGAVEPPMPEHLATLLKQLEPTEWSTSAASSQLTCPRCKFTMVQVVHVHAFGGHPALGAYQCPKCRYIAGSMSEAGSPLGTHRSATG